MAELSNQRGVSRDRHGRGLRQPLLSNLLSNSGRHGSFEQIVSGTCDYLIEAWPDELAQLSWEVLDAPTIKPESNNVRRWAVKRDVMTIIIYRLPIERMAHHRRVDPLHERMHIEENVFAAVGHLLGKDPWELVPDRYRN